VAILPIVVLGGPDDAVLRRPSNRVRDVREKSVQKLIDDMFETMRDAPGVGLAAPQVGLPFRLIVVEKVDDAYPALALANPEIVRSSGRRKVTEGCLSIPGYQGELYRSEIVVVKGIGRDGKEVRIKAPPSSLLAQALEHEIGHINGNLYIDNLESRDDLYRIQTSPVPAGRQKEGDAAD
jgi:peptide deformylase